MLYCVCWLKGPLSAQTGTAQPLDAVTQTVNVGETRVYRMIITSGSTVDWDVIGGVKVSESTSGTQSFISVEWGNPGSGTITATEAADGCPSEDKILNVTIVAVSDITFNLVQPQCPGGKGTIKVNNPVASGGHYYQYQLEKDNGGIWEVAIVYAGEENSPNPYSFLDVSEGTYRVKRRKINKNNDIPFTGSETISSDIVIKANDTGAPVFLENLSDIVVDSDAGSCGAVVWYNNPVVEGNCPFSGDLTNFTFVGEFNGHTYYLSNSEMNVTNASATAIAAGGHLVTIEDVGENNYLINNTVLKANVNEGIWLGLNDLESEGSFKWTTGGVPGYTNWNEGEPNNSSGNENWGQIYIKYGGVVGDPRNGTWNDIPESALMKFVVEFEGSRFEQIEGNPSGDQFSLGTTTNTFEIINPDGSGTGITKSFTVTVSDNIPPVINTCPSSQEVCADIDNTGTVLNVALVSELSLTDYSDNCSDLSVSYEIKDKDGSLLKKGDGIIDEYQFPIGVNTVTYYVTDGVNTTSCQFAITVYERPNPSSITALD